MNRVNTGLKQLDRLIFILKTLNCFTALGILRSSYKSGDKCLAPPDLKDLERDDNSIGDLSLSLRKCVSCLRSLSRSISCRYVLWVVKEIQVINIVKESKISFIVLHDVNVHIFLYLLTGLTLVLSSSMSSFAASESSPLIVLVSFRGDS